jgi:hypothetical protein
MMLDQKRAFDEVVATHAKDPAAVARILANPVYAQVSGTLAGSQEYAAMVKLHDLDATGRWDLIVVDTPADQPRDRLPRGPGQAGGGDRLARRSSGSASSRAAAAQAGRCSADRAPSSSAGWPSSSARGSSTISACSSPSSTTS